MDPKIYIEIRDYLGDWLKRSQQAADAAPTVQQLYDVAEWEVRTLERCPAEAASIPTSHLDEHAESLFKRVTMDLPMIPEVDPARLAELSATVVGSSSAVFMYAQEAANLQTPATEQFASEALTEYRLLQESHQRPEEVRTLLRATLPVVLSKFDSAWNSYQQYKSGHGTETAAAIEMRTFLDGLKGELFARARHHPADNMTFDIALERLYSSAPTRTAVEQQFKHRSFLIEPLSAVGKRRDPLGVYDLEALWAQVLDHAFIVVDALGSGAG